MLAVLQSAIAAQTPAGRQRASAARSGSAAAKQAASVRRQSGVSAAGSFFILGWEPRGRSASRPPIKADCAVLPDAGLLAVIAPAAAEFKVDPLLIRAIVDQESGGRPCAVSSAGAQGLMQLMPATQPEVGVEDPFDPAQNVRGGTRYLRQLLDRYKGNVSLALAAYNAGPARVEDRIPDIAETRDYVAAILEQTGAASVEVPTRPE